MINFKINLKMIQKINFYGKGKINFKKLFHIQTRHLNDFFKQPIYTYGVNSFINTDIVYLININ